MLELKALEIPPDVLGRAREGEGVALEAIYRTCYPGVHALVRRLVARSAVTEDITQDVFIQVLRNLDGYAGRGPFGAWVRSIAVSRCFMHLRSPWNRAALWFTPAEDGAAEQAADPLAGLSADDPEIRSRREELALEQALAKLPPISRMVVWLHDVEDYTHAEIALELGRSVSFSKSQLARAHERLRQLLKSQDERMACTPARLSC